MVFVDSSTLENWADTPEARTELPRLIRKLILASAKIKQISVPAGRSVDSPGWDGVVTADQGNAWVPDGRSYWEVSSQKSIGSKASEDFKKRLTAADGASTFIFVTPRRWRAKNEWAMEKGKLGLWKDVRAYDADDLEQWLEQCPAVALEFAERFGQAGPGVTSAREAWDRWAAQSEPAITPKALLAGRQHIGRELLERIKNPSSTRSFVGLQADSAEEAVAFVIATLMEQDEATLARTVVITTEEGWRFVRQNSTLALAIASRPEVAKAVPRREGLTAIIPYAAGDPQRCYAGRAGKLAEQTLKLDRPDTNAFEEALAGLGIKPGEAERLARNTGRSWSVLRRRLARNPAIRTPEWLEDPAAAVLSVLCLVGAWDDCRDADKAIVSEIAGRPYEEVERDLRKLSGMLDAPVLRLGSIWKAKAPLELFDLWHQRLTEAEIERFFKVAKRLLIVKDPALDLAPEQRWYASLDGKQRPESGILRESLCDSLAKMAALGAEQFAHRAERLVHELLWEADRERWLSLADHLPSLAEAAPETFLQCVERSLSRSDCPIRGLFEDTDDAGSFGGWYHGSLLWALEILAWAPKRLARVALILARMSNFPTGSWANTPLSTLVNLFRSWMPQTAANLQERVAALNVLIREAPDVAFEVLDALVYHEKDHMIPAARPKWRDEDAGAGAGISPSEARYMYVLSLNQMLRLAEGNADRLCSLIKKWKIIFELGCGETILSLLKSFAQSRNDESEHEKVRSTIRESLYFAVHSQTKESNQFLEQLSGLLDDLMPLDTVLRHKWLFDEYQPHLTGASASDDWRERERQILAARRTAIQEIWKKEGWGGLARLARSCSKPGLVGQALASVGMSSDYIVPWLCEQIGREDGVAPLSPFIRGLLCACGDELASQLMEAVYNTAQNERWSARRIVQAFDLFPSGPNVWDVIARFGKSVEREYWCASRYVAFVRRDCDDTQKAAQKLLEAHRPWTALRLIEFQPDTDSLSADLLFRILSAIAAGWELKRENGNDIDPYLVVRAVEGLENSANVSRQDLALLEFRLFPLLAHHKDKAKSLFFRLVNDPNFFVDILKLVYKGDAGEVDRPLDESREAAARIAFQVLRSCRVIPGLTDEGTVVAGDLNRFVGQARALAEACGRLKVCDLTLGEIFAWAPAGEDGIWPCKPVGELLDRSQMEGMRRGLFTGLYNKRGVVTKSMGEGGKQELALAQKYRDMAQGLCGRGQIRLAATLDDLAYRYEFEARAEDEMARKRREGLF